MKTRRQSVSEDSVSISRHLKRLKTSENGRENSEPIPNDLVIEVLSRLPVKSIARFRSLSKTWASILLHPYFTELFLSRSSACPKLLFVCQKDDELQFFSSPQPQNADENLSVVAANHHMRFSFDCMYSKILTPVHGLIGFKHARILKGKKETVIEIRNPSTGQCLTSPKVKSNRLRGNSFLGYDPIEKQFKLLSMTRLSYVSNRSSSEHQILTLGTGKLSWRMIECSISHYPLCAGICINGVLYYRAGVGVGRLGGDYGIVCFDIKSEKFKFIEAANVLSVKLVNYRGKLATLKSNHEVGARIFGATISFELGVLEDAEKHEWSYHTYVLPLTRMVLVGLTRTAEIVLSPCNLFNGFYLIYYNLERNTVIKVEIQGMDASKYHKVHTFLAHVEDVKLWGSV